MYDKYVNRIDACERKYCRSSTSGSLPQASSSTPGICYASFSSVYGMNREVPYAVEDQVDNSVILYIALRLV